MGILRDLFGPSKTEVWQQLSLEIGGNYDPGGFWSGAKVQGFHSQWVITLDTFKVNHGESHSTYTRMRAPYVNPDGFQFTVYRKSLFSDLALLFGSQDINVGNRDFDDDFIIQGTMRRKWSHSSPITEFANCLLPSLLFTSQ